MKWYQCKPCRKLTCGDAHPKFCARLVGVCHSSGCYCQPGLVWHDKLKNCVNEQDCRKISVDDDIDAAWESNNDIYS